MELAVALMAPIAPILNPMSNLTHWYYARHVSD